MLADASAEELERMVQESYDAMSKRLVELRNKLGRYGFCGDCNLSLDVTIKHKTYGTEEATVKRDASHSFARS